MKRIASWNWRQTAAISLALGATAVGSVATETLLPPTSAPLGSLGGSSLAPARVAVDSAGRFYVTEPDLGRVSVFDAFGRLIVVRTPSPRPLAIATGPSGVVYIGDEQDGSVQAFDPNWRPIRALGQGPGEFGLPNYIAVVGPPDRETVYVSDSLTSRVRAYVDGALVRTFGGPGTNAGEFDFPTGLLVTPQAELVVVDQNNSRIQVFSEGGTFQRQFSAITTSGSSLGGAAGGRSQGIALDASGRVYVADTLQGLINVFTDHGTLLSKIGGFGEGWGRLRAPAGVCLDRLQRLAIASSNNRRVELIGVDSYFHLSAKPARPVVAAGATVEFSVVAGGTGPFSYQWRKDGIALADGVSVSGTTGTNLVLADLTTAGSGLYTVTVSSPQGSIVSPPARLGVLTPPRIVRPPQSATVAPGSAIELEVATEGDSLIHQWRFNDAELAGATNPVLRLHDLHPNQSGRYRVEIVNPVGTTSSADAIVRVLAPPSIAVAPGNSMVIEGTDVQLEVSANGDDLAYQWRFNGTNLTGATTAALSRPSIALAHAGDYSVIVSNSVGYVTSAIAQVVVVPSPNPPRIVTATFPSADTIRFLLTGDRNYTYTLQASADLHNWSRVTNVANSLGTVEVIIPIASSSAQQFYRLRWSPY